MSDPKEFLSRWSQRKLNPEAEKSAPEEKTAALPAAGDETAVPAAPVPEFDITTLPSLESIGANSDIRAFLQSGVPGSLTRAALRRAWSADPAIRDFVGLSENAWDFNAPDSIPGFGSLNADEARQVAARFFGALTDETTGQAPASEVASEKASQISAETQEAEAHPAQPDSSAAPAQQPVIDVAAQQEKQDEPTDSLPSPRRHGGALPE